MIIEHKGFKYDVIQDDAHKVILRIRNYLRENNNIMALLECESYLTPIYIAERIDDALNYYDQHLEKKDKNEEL